MYQNRTCWWIEFTGYMQRKPAIGGLSFELLTNLAGSQQMEQEPAAQKNIAMLGDGFYSRVSLGPKAVIDNCRSLVFDALDLVDQSATQRPLTIADFGSADGGTSLDLVGSVVRRARARHAKRSINVVYTDLPGADFGTLFRHVNNEIDGKPGYLHNLNDVHVFCSGISFYKQILPTASLDLAFSASAMHYLSRMPAVINDHVHAVGASDYERAEYRAVAIDDWNRMLLQRSQELAPHGRLVMANFCIDEHGHYLGNTGGENLFDNYNLIWSQMRDQSVITDGEYRNTAFQQFYKSIDDTLKPLNDERSSVFQSGLVLDRQETRTVACPFRIAYEQGRLSRAEFATQFVNTHRSWTETTFRAGLLESRSASEKQAILDELYRRFEQMVVDKPQGHGKDLLHLYIVARKRSENTA